MVDQPGSIGNFGVQPAAESDRIGKPSDSADRAGKASFEDVLRDSIESVEEAQHDASAAIENMALGKTESFAEVMTAGEKSDIAFRTLMQVRNKLVDAYEELLRIRI